MHHVRAANTRVQDADQGVYAGLKSTAPWRRQPFEPHTTPGPIHSGRTIAGASYDRNLRPELNQAWVQLRCVRLNASRDLGNSTQPESHDLDR